MSNNTPVQGEIYTTGKFKIYRSSAGSGKTFTLTKEYLKLALATPGIEGFSPFYFRFILAVTFTNDAASEMKERILNNLSEISHLKEGEKHDMLALIQEELKLEYPELDLGEKELKIRASALHETILHRYTDFSVSTIDAFSNRVVQSFKKDLNLPYNYDIVLEVDELLEEASDLLQDQIGTDNEIEIGNLLVEFAIKKADEESSWYIDDALKKFGKQLFNEERIEHIEAISDLKPTAFKKIIANIYKYIAGVDKELMALGETALDLIKSNGISEAALARGKQGIAGFFNKAASSGSTIIELNLNNSYIKKTLEDDKWTSGKANAAEKSAIDGIKVQLSEIYYQIERLAIAETGNYIIASNLKRNIYLLATVNELNKKINEIKEEKNQVHISDFNRKINQIVEEEPVPYIYERLGDRFKHILIDEFQDTSRMQWHNLIPLVLNALGLNMGNLIVGDAKQAIYRWRGGKADMLVNLPAVPTAPLDSVIAMEAEALKQHHLPLALSINRRSKANVIRFNNQFFTELKDKYAADFPALSGFYDDVAQETTKKEGGFVKMEFIQQKLSKAISKEATFQRVFTHITDLVQSGEFQYSDIAILVRSNRDGAFLAERLMENNINVVSNESLLLHNSPLIKFITGFLRVIAFPVYPVLKIELIEFLDQHFQKLDSKRETIGGEAYSELSGILQENDLYQFFEWLNEFFGADLQVRGIQFRTLYEITEELIRQFQLHFETEQQVYIQKFLDVVLSFSTKKGNSLLDFIDYWDNQEGKISVSSPGKSTAVRIMTIHKSKGLQFPVVILPFANWTLKPQTFETRWFDWHNPNISGDLHSVILPVKSDLEKTVLANEYLNEIEQVFLDAINVLYVGFTRPEAALIVISDEKENSKSESSVADLLYNYSASLPAEKQLEDVEIEVVTESKESATVKVISSLPLGELPQAKDTVELKAESEEKPDSEDSKVQTYELKEFIHTSNTNKIRMRKNTLRYDDSNISLKEIFSSRKEGLLIHYAFEKVKYREDIPQAVLDLVHEGLIDTDVAARYEKKMLEATHLPEIAPYFEKSNKLKIKNEKEIILSGRGKATGASLRPDRIVRLDDELVIIDYKTGKENEEKYAQQLKGYAKAFKDMGYQKIKMFILYTELLQVTEVK